MWVAVSAALYAAGIGALLLFGLNLFVLSVAFVKHDRGIPGPVPDPDESETPAADWPSVTVQLPLYNEALVADRVIAAAAALDYPRALLQIQVLDDSDDLTRDIAAAAVARRAERGVDICHVTRDVREGYKAGALQHGLESARGELIAVFDADFVPRPDFLRRIVPSFRDPHVGMVQSRWSHQNADASLLTRLQAFALDAHFAVEQRVRNLLGWFINFNGTAGMWRRTCIEDAGGWQADTLTEDLDLSYRAQLRGWKFVYRPDVTAPAELPENMNAFRAQQFRWTKGAAQTAIKLIPGLWGSQGRIAVKLEGTFHLTAHLAYPFVLLVALLHAPLLWAKNTAMAPGQAYFASLAVGLVGFTGFFLSQLLAQRDLHADWQRRMLLFPAFMAASMAMSVSNARGIVEAVARRPSPFVRTPKRSDADEHPYLDLRLPRVVWVELALAVYSIGGLAVAVLFREWAAVPFQLLFAFGFSLVSVFSLANRTG